MFLICFSFLNVHIHSYLGNISNKEQGVLQQKVWPPHSPYLNIMEAVWDYLEDKYIKTLRQNKSTKQLRQLVQGGWSDLQSLTVL